MTRQTQITEVEEKEELETETKETESSSNPYQLTIKLPSRGIHYDPTLNLDKDIVIRMMTVEDEKKLFGSYNDKSLNNLVSDCIVSPKIDPDILVPTDKEYILYQLRILTYGETYLNSSRCPHCGNVNTDKINLSKLDLIEHDEDDFPVMPYQITLPVSKRKVALRELTGIHTEKINKRAKEMAKTVNIPEGETRYISSLAMRIAEIDGEQVKFSQARNFIEQLQPRDIAYITHSISKFRTGYTGTFETTCKNPNCGQAYDAEVAITSEFFRPTIFD